MMYFQKDVHSYRLSKQINIRNKGLKVIYKASENELLTSKFHAKCDAKGPIITIIQANMKIVLVVIHQKNGQQQVIILSQE